MSKTTQHSRWKDGDFTIITSDDVKFSVPSYHLMSASAVFRDMVDVGSGPKQIELDETANTIGQFMELVVDGHTRLRPDDHGYQKATSLVRFLRKYECQAAIGNLTQVVQVPSDDRDIHTLKLIMAMHLDDRYVVRRAIEKEPESFIWLRPVQEDTNLSNALPYDAFRLIPPRYLWALLAADISNTDRLRPAPGCVFRGPAERFDYYLKQASDRDGL